MSDGVEYSFAGEGAAGDHRAVGHFEIVAVVAVENHFVGGVGQFDVAEGLAETEIAVVEKRVARKCVAVFGNHERTAVEVGLRGLGVVDARAGVDCAVAGDDGRCGVENGDVGQRVVEHLLGVDVERVRFAERFQMYVFAEERILRRRGVFAVPRVEAIFFIGEDTADFIVAQLDAEVVVEYVGGEFYVFVDETHFLARICIENCQLGSIVVVELVAVDKKSIALLHPHVAEGADLGAPVEKERRIAVHIHIALAEKHVANHGLVIRTGFGAQFGGALQKHFVALIAVGRRDCRPDGGCVGSENRLASGWSSLFFRGIVLRAGNERSRRNGYGK